MLGVITYSSMSLIFTKKKSTKVLIILQLLYFPVMYLTSQLLLEYPLFTAVLQTVLLASLGLLIFQTDVKHVILYFIIQQLVVVASAVIGSDILLFINREEMATYLLDD